MKRRKLTGSKWHYGKVASATLILHTRCLISSIFYTDLHFTYIHITQLTCPRDKFYRVNIFIKLALSQHFSEENSQVIYQLVAGKLLYSRSLLRKLSVSLLQSAILFPSHWFILPFFALIPQKHFIGQHFLCWIHKKTYLSVPANEQLWIWCLLTCCKVVGVWF